MRAPAAHPPARRRRGIRPKEHKSKAAVFLGERVIVDHCDGCRACHECRSGWTQICVGRGRTTFGGTNGHGAHARYRKVPAHTLIRMPDAMSFKAGAAASCGTGTAYGARRAFRQGDGMQFEP